MCLFGLLVKQVWVNSAVYSLSMSTLDDKIAFNPLELTHLCCCIPDSSYIFDPDSDYHQCINAFHFLPVSLIIYFL